MSQTAIPLEFERYLQNQVSLGKAPDMNEMIFAYIPGLDPSQPIDRSQGLPDVSLWVHQQDIDQVGKLGDNILVYSVVIPGDEEEFTFNAIYLRDKNVPNSCGIVVHKAEETKENGMASTKSLAQQYDGAAQIAGITVDAATWQIDYQARLKGIEEDHRLACLDTYGHAAFVDGFDVTQQPDPDKYKVTPGVVYVGGLRGVLSGEVLQTITTKPNGLYVDVVRQGTALSVWENIVTITASETELVDYIDGNGNQHYVAKLAEINADGIVVDWRVKGGLAEHELVSQFMPYNSDRVYTTGEICYTRDQATGELSYWQWYSNVESLAGKSPLLEANRHVGWSDNNKPFYWVPYTGDQVGMPFYWLDVSAPEWAVMEINVDLPIAVYWRLARRYPHLVSGATINTGEIRAEFLRVLDQGRGIDSNRVINSHQRGSYIPGDNGTGDTVYVNSAYNQAKRDALGWDEVRDTGGIVLGDVKYFSPTNSDMPINLLSSHGGVARPSNVARPMAIVI